VKSRTGINTESADSTRVVGDLGMYQNQIEH
jgi:hypothetical protein